MTDKDNTNNANPPADPNNPPKPTTPEDQQQEFLSKLYKEVAKILGGENTQQLLCLTFPGLALAQETYQYDLSKPKPAVVEYEESLLANKMFDVAKVTGSDNARLLTQQYRTALEVLVPSINFKLAEAKGQLRKVLLTPMRLNIKGVMVEDTLQQIFFRLYDEWIAEKKVWADMQLSKKRELEQKFKETIPDYGQRRKNEFLEWYEVVAETYLQQIDQKYSAILGLFSPADMHVIQGILSSGSGEELYEARTLLMNAKKITPDGGSAYPVSLQPANWFEYLDNSFSPVDLLESKEAISMSLKQKVHERNTILAAIDQIQVAIPSQGEAKATKDAYKKAKDAHAAASSTLGKDYSAGALSVLDAASLVASKMKKSNMEEKDATDLESRDTSDKNFSTSIKNVLKDAIANTNALVTAQGELLDAAIEVTKLESMLAKDKNLASLGKMLVPLQRQLSEVTAEITELENKLGLACQIAKTADANNGSSKEADEKTVTPNRVPKGFMSLVVTSEVSQMQSSEVSFASSNTEKKSGGFWFFSAGKTTTTSASSEQSSKDDFKASMSVGMSVAKVSIVRNWFNPGVFALTNSMFNASSSKVSYGLLENDNYDLLNKAIFPCFPVSFVVARDVTIKFSVQSDQSATFAQTAESHAASGGGFLCFRGSSSSSSSSSSSGAKVSAQGNSVVIRFTDPQIIGYYLQFVPTDESKAIDYKIDKTANEIQQDMSFFDFIQKFQEIIANSQNAQASIESANAPTNAIREA